MMRTRIDRFKVKQLMGRREPPVEKFEDLAALASLSPTTIYNSLDDYNWRSTTADAIANALGCTSHDITTIDEVPA